jgi:hypothetical protein
MTPEKIDDRTTAQSDGFRLPLDNENTPATMPPAPALNFGLSAGKNLAV